MNNFSFIISNVVANEIELLSNILSQTNVFDYMEEINELDGIKNQLREIEKKVRLKKINK